MAFKPSRKPPSKRDPLSPAVVSQLHNVTPERKNDIRGVLSDAQSGVTAEHIMRLRDNDLAEDMLAASFMINAPNGLRKRRVRALKQAEIWKLHSQDCKSLEAEIAYASGFLNAWPSDTFKAIGTISLLSRVADVSLSDAIGAIETVSHEWGSSNYLSYKIAYLKIQPGLTDENYAHLNVVDNILGHAESPGIQFSAIEKRLIPFAQVHTTN